MKIAIVPSMKDFSETLEKRREKGLEVLRRRVRFREDCGKERGLGIVRLCGSTR